MPRPSFVPLALCLAAGLLAGGCGFHLRGDAKLKPTYSSIYLDAPDRYSALDRALVDALTDAGATLRPTRGDGPVVELTRDETGRRIMSVSARNVPTEYEVYYRVTYRFVYAGDQVLAPTEIELTRVISFDETAQLEKEREERLVREALARDIAERIVRQLAAL